MTDVDIQFQKIDKIIADINFFKIDPDFSNEIVNRNLRSAPKELTDEKLLEVFTTLIAFSGQAPSNKVKDALNSGIFNVMFNQFNVEQVALMNPCDLVDTYWDKVSPIRYQTKLFQIVMFARRIRRIGSLSSLLSNSQIPIRLHTKNDIDRFWNGFDILQTSLKTFKVSYLKETTTLLHYLLDTGFDCVKPDLVVMKVAKNIGIVESDKGDKNFRIAVRFLQEYCLNRQIRPSIIDLYLLIDGGQKEMKKLVHPNFYKRQYLN
jgi:hypothetical protein